jgi:hypothetical protein
MGYIRERFEAMGVAVAFAERGEREFANQVLRGPAAVRQDTAARPRPAARPRVGSQRV